MKQNNKRISPNDAGKQIIVLTQTNRTSIDIGSYTSAIKAADNIKHPNRIKWLDIVDELLTDAHLRAVIQKRKSAVLSIPIEFQRNGKPDEKIAEQLRSPWFYAFLEDALDTPVLGNTLVQFYIENGWIGYDLIPRKHFDPVNRFILKNQGDTKGTPFGEFPDLLFIGEPRDLGLMQAAAPYVIYKRNSMADWAQFSEIYGMPLLEGEYDSSDDEARQRLITDMWDRGANSALLHPTGTKLTIHDLNSKAGSSDLYKSFSEFCNAEISKLFLGNTLTTEAGEKGTQALGTVHKKVEERIEQTDKQFILNLLNYQMSDIFASLGINTTGGEFTFVVPQDKDLSARIQIDMRLKNMGLPIGDDYLYETYGIEKPANYDELKKSSTPLLSPLPKGTSEERAEGFDDKQDDKKSPKNFKNRGKRFFFVKAPARNPGAASNWD